MATRPDRLYKYQPFSDRVVDNLVRRQVHFQSPSDFNDPFEFDARLVEGDYSQSELRAMIREVLPAEDRDAYIGGRDAHWEVKRVMRQMMESLLERSCVACFSRNHDHPLMWAHYADEHRGLCLEFSSESWVVQEAIEVHYTCEPPEFDPSDFLSKQNLESTQNLEFLAATKMDAWRYEQEWRCVHDKEASQNLEYEPEHLSDIYLGLRMEADHRNQIKAILEGTETRIFVMKRSETGYQLEAVDFH